MQSNSFMEAIGPSNISFHQQGTARLFWCKEQGMQRNRIGESNGIIRFWKRRWWSGRYVRNPNPVVTNVQEIALAPANNGMLLLHRLALLRWASSGRNIFHFNYEFTKRLGYLIEYPHGCIEQILHQYFLNWYWTIDRIKWLPKAQVDKNKKQDLRLQFQRPDGGFSYWPGGKWVMNGVQLMPAILPGDSPEQWLFCKWLYVAAMEKLPTW